MVFVTVSIFVVLIHVLHEVSVLMYDGPTPFHQGAVLLGIGNYLIGSREVHAHLIKLGINSYL